MSHVVILSGWGEGRVLPLGGEAGLASLAQIAFISYGAPAAVLWRRCVLSSGYVC
jgi:hypothetical protein